MCCSYEVNCKAENLEICCFLQLLDFLLLVLFAATHDHMDRLETRLENTVGDEGFPDLFSYDERYSNRGGPFFVDIL